MNDSTTKGQTTPADSGGTTPPRPLAKPDAGRWAARSAMKKKSSMEPSRLVRLEGLALLILSVLTVIFLYDSGRSLLLFPVPDSFRWAGGESWMLLGWKSLIASGHLVVPIASGSTFDVPPGLFLRSEWLTAVIYGLPQLLMPASTDPIHIGRTVSFTLGLATLGVIMFTSAKLRWPTAPTALALILLIITPAFSFATHSARYEVLTALLLLAYVAHFARRREAQKTMGPASAFMVGAFAMMLAIFIGPQLIVLLIPMSIFVAWEFGMFRTWKRAVGLAAGYLAGFAVAIGVSVATKNGSSVFCYGDTLNPFGSVFSGLLAGRPFGLSRALEQSILKISDLWMEAPIVATVAALSVASHILLQLKQRLHPSTQFIMRALVVAIIAVLVLEATRPYYLVHLLPLVMLAFGAQLNEWRGTNLFRGVMIAAALATSIGIALVWLPELNQAAATGRRMSEANTAAVQASVELVSRGWGRELGVSSALKDTSSHDIAKPCFLAQGPAVHELLRDSTISLISESFLQYPREKIALDSFLMLHHVNYVIDYGRLGELKLMVASGLARPIFARVGEFLDRTVDYWHDTVAHSDTLTLYQIGPLDAE